MIVVGEAVREVNTRKKSFMDSTPEEMEERLAKTTQRARDNLHANGLPYVIGDDKGVYEVYPDGHRVFTPYRKREANER
ncbi:hypothetical protein FACS1894187_22150 [Synergistales bacterium]|nr:hypothetical protein FACS1894187_22150 [Synergistales bacterium]